MQNALNSRTRFSGCSDIGIASPSFRQIIAHWVGLDDAMMAMILTSSSRPTLHEWLRHWPKSPPRITHPERRGAAFDRHNEDHRHPTLNQTETLFISPCDRMRQRSWRISKGSRAPRCEGKGHQRSARPAEERPRHLAWPAAALQRVAPSSLRSSVRRRANRLTSSRPGRCDDLSRVGIFIL